MKDNEVWTATLDDKYGQCRRDLHADLSDRAGD